MHEQIQKSEFHEHRVVGAIHRDLRFATKIYLLDPCSKRRLQFNNVKSLLKYVGDIKNEFLSYASNLQNSENFQTVVQLRRRDLNQRLKF